MGWWKPTFFIDTLDMLVLMLIPTFFIDTFFIHCWLCHWYLAEKWSQLPNSACWVKPGIFAKIWGEENLWDIDGDLPMYPTKYVHNIYIYTLSIYNNNN